MPYDRASRSPITLPFSAHCARTPMRGTRTTVDANIYRDDYGFEIIVRRRGATGRARYKGHHYSIQFLRSERQRITDDLDDSTPIIKGTLAGDFAEMLKSLPDGSIKRNRSSDGKHWIDAGFGTLPRHKLTPEMIERQCRAWSDCAASTIKHRLDALRAVYQFHDDDAGPVAKVPRPKERRDVRIVPQALIEAVLMQLGTGKNHARIRVIARTGLPHAQIKRLRPADLDLVGRTMFIVARKKGAGVPGRTLPITHAAVLAFEEFVAHEAFGPFSNASLYKAFQRAVGRAREKWCKHCGPWPAPPHFRPYDLRHGFLTEVYRRTRDLRVTAELGLHADMTITAMYAQAAVSENANAARDKLDGMLPDGTTPK